MGGFGGGNSGGSSGGAGPAGRKSDGSYGTARDAQRASGRNEGRKATKEIVDFIKGGGVTGKVIRSINKSQKQKNRKTKGGDVFGGEAYGFNEAAEKRDFKGNRNVNTGPDRDGPSPAEKAQGIELAKKIEKQTITDNQLVKRTQAKAKGEAPKGPTSVEMAQAEEDDEAKRLLRIKRKGRKQTILNVPEEELTLSKKQLLG